MNQIKTNDGSITCYSEEFRESYHSVSGAIEEAFKKYIEPCKIAEIDNVKILDICFGIGYNCAAAIHEILKKDHKAKIVAIEYDKKILDEIKHINVPSFFEESYHIIRDVAKNGYYKEKNIEIKLIIGDARKTIKELNEKFDAVFLDPFSTTKNPELWTVEFFKEIKEVMKPEAILATYSSSAIVRSGLIESGFKIGNGPVIGRYRPSTLASINIELPELSGEDIKLINAFGTPYHDPELKLDRKTIIKRREEEIFIKKSLQKV